MAGRTATRGEFRRCVIVGAVSEDDRQERRLGDATRNRIADLADGWSLPAQDPGSEARSETKPRPATDHPTEPFEKDAPETFAAEQATAVGEPTPEALAALRGHAQRASTADVQRSLTPLRLEREGGRPPPPPPPRRRSPTPPERPAVLPTLVQAGRDDDATTIEPPSMLSGEHSPVHGVGVVRVPPRLRRTPGVLGDLTYVFTVVRDVRRARKELLEVEDEITTLKADRASRLADLGRAAVADDRFDQTAIRNSRDRLVDIEERRSRHAGAAAAADAELDAIERERESALRAASGQIESGEEEIAKLDAQIAPLEREAAAARRRAAQVKDTLASIDARIAAARASLVAVKGPHRDSASVEAELASLKADREAVQRDEPAIAADLDRLLPRIASLESARDAARQRIAEARAAEIDARARASEKVAAVQARRRVESRAAADAKSASERALIELGERLYVERPGDLTLRLAAVDKQDVAIATAQRRAIELRELLGSVEKGALARGIGLWLLLVTIVVTAILIVV